MANSKNTHIHIDIYIQIIIYNYIYTVYLGMYRYVCIDIPTPIGGTKPTCRIPLFFAWNPWDSDPTPQMDF